MAEKVRWQSVSWPDGSRYEGLVKKDLCHVRGGVNYADGDRYLGEFSNNHMDGYGVYTWHDGTLYRGQWQNSMMHGCGVKISKQPNGRLIAEEGQFVNDEWVGDVKACTVEQARKAAAEADTAAQMAKVFELTHAAPPPSKPAPLPAQAGSKAAKSAVLQARGGGQLAKLQEQLQGLLAKLPRLPQPSL